MRELEALQAFQLIGLSAVVSIFTRTSQVAGFLIGLVSTSHSPLKPLPRNRGVRGIAGFLTVRQL